eukprot:14403807-Alexandrium_andersonii.AAC.1
MSTSSTSQPTNRRMAERPSFRRVGPEKRCRHLGALLALAVGAGGSGACSCFTSGAEGPEATGVSSAGVGASRSHLPFDLPPPFPWDFFEV